MQTHDDLSERRTMITDGHVEQEAEYPYPPLRVWRALVDPGELHDWLMPNEGFRPEPGTSFSLETGSENFGTIEGEVLDVDEPSLLRCRWSGVFGDTIVTFRLTPTDLGTLLRVEHAAAEGGPWTQSVSFDDGWAEKLAIALPKVLDAQ
jgi:uncharacterized protein YndB with AHSA1/START domain